MAVKDDNKEPKGTKKLVKSRAKTKGGCKTCKIRKVKCDEGRPCCYRCTSTGRICEGYGIWGGGDADSHYTQKQQTWVVYKCIELSSSLAKIDPIEKHYFEWFRGRTVIKLPGVFGSEFWEILVMQISHNESAALNAVLAVSCAHKKLKAVAEGQAEACAEERDPDDEERFLLKHYSRAISDVQHHFSANDKASIRIVLTICMLFVILEFMRGRTRAGIKHLQYGLKVINNIESKSVTGLIAHTPESWESIDRWLLVAFARLNLQSWLFGQPCGSLRPYWQILLAPSLTPVFDCISHARETLDDLMSQILELREESAQADTLALASHCQQGANERQNKLQSSLESWIMALENSQKTLQAQLGFLTPIACQTLRTRYYAAKIMAARCLSYRNESSYDRNTRDFLAIIQESIKTWIFCFSADLKATRYAHRPDVAPFVVDGPWIWPLYFLALKCRVRRLRQQAIALLDSTHSMEAVADSKMASAIVKEVVAIEEGGLYDDKVFANDFECTDVPKADELLPPALPESCRVYDVQVELPNGYHDLAKLTCKWKADEHGYEILTRDYDPRTQSWINSTATKQFWLD